MFHDINEYYDENYYYYYCYYCAFQVLTENNLNKKSSLKSKIKKTTEKLDIIHDETIYQLQDDSLIEEDDVDKDPDWKKTPLYNRIQKLQVIILYNLTIITFIQICLLLMTQK